jgi:hypothetical protein
MQRPVQRAALSTIFGTLKILTFPLQHTAHGECEQFGLSD